MAASRTSASQLTTEFLDSVKAHDRGPRMIAHWMLPQEPAVDGVMRDALVKAFRESSGMQGETPGRTSIYRAVYQVCLDRSRSERRRLDAPPPETEATGCIDSCAVAYRGPRSHQLAVLDRAARDRSDDVAQRVDLATGLTSLPEDQRTAVLLVDVIGMSEEETARVLGVRAGTIAPRLQHARSVLQATRAERTDEALEERLRNLEVPEYTPDFFATLQGRLETEAASLMDVSAARRRGTASAGRRGWFRRRSG